MNDFSITMKENAPYLGNDIYLEKNDKQVIAVCSNSEIANEIANVLNKVYIPSESDLQTAEIYKKIIVSGYYLLIAIEQSKICVNSLLTLILLHSHDEFYELIHTFIQLNPTIMKFLNLENKNIDIPSNKNDVDSINEAKEKTEEKSEEKEKIINKNISTAIIKFEDFPDYMIYCNSKSYPVGLGFELLSISEDSRDYDGFFESNEARFSKVTEIPHDILYEYIILKDGNVHCQESWFAADKSYHGGGIRHGGIYNLKEWRNKVKLLDEYSYRRPEYWS